MGFEPTTSISTLFLLENEVPFELESLEKRYIFLRVFWGNKQGAGIRYSILKLLAYQHINVWRKSTAQIANDDARISVTRIYFLFPFWW